MEAEFSIQVGNIGPFHNLFFLFNNLFSAEDFIHYITIILFSVQ